MPKSTPISLLNTGGKVLEKLIIDRINHHLFSNSLINNNQFGFRPQKSTIDAALAAKDFAKDHLQQRNYVVIISLDVLGAFDAAWWPSILNNLRNLRCPTNLYNLTKSYFSDRVATWHANTYRIFRKVSRGCKLGSLYKTILGWLQASQHFAMSLLTLNSTTGSACILPRTLCNICCSPFRVANSVVL
jgi:hypothetical protein